MSKEPLSKTIKPGEAVATTNIVGYEGKELAVFIGVAPESYGLLYIQWLMGPVEKVFREDFDKTFYKVKITGINEYEGITVKRPKKYEKKKDSNTVELTNPF